MEPGMVARTHMGFREPRKMLKLELGQGSSEAPDQTHEKSLPGNHQQVLPSLRTVEEGTVTTVMVTAMSFLLGELGKQKMKCWYLESCEYRLASARPK